MSENHSQAHSSESALGAAGGARLNESENAGVSVAPRVMVPSFIDPTTIRPNNNTSFLLRLGGPPPLNAPRPPRSPSHRPIEENRLRPIGPGNHDRAWNDPPMFSVDANTRPSGQRSRLNERVAFPMNGTPSNSAGGYYINPPSDLPGPRLFVPAPPVASATPPMAQMMEEPRPFIPEPPPPPPGSGDFGRPVLLFYGNLPQPITAPHTITVPAGRTLLNHPNILNDS